MPKHKAKSAIEPFTLGCGDFFPDVPSWAHQGGDVLEFSASRAGCTDLTDVYVHLLSHLPDLLPDEKVSFAAQCTSCKKYTSVFTAPLSKHSDLRKSGARCRVFEKLVEHDKTCDQGGVGMSVDQLLDSDFQKKLAYSV